MSTTNWEAVARAMATRYASALDPSATAEQLEARAAKLMEPDVKAYTPKPPKPKKVPKSRPERWNAACAEARDALERTQAAAGDLNTAMDDLRGVRDEYQEWKDNMPEGLSSSPLGEKLDAVTGIDMPEDEVDLSAWESALDEAEGADLPRGFGKD